MKKWLLAAVMAPAVAFAKPVSFDFSGVSLVAFSQATFKSILGRDYVIAPEVLAADRKITISVKSIDSDQVPAFVENLLQQQGISVTLRDGVYYLGQASRQPEQQQEKGTDAAAAYPAVQAADKVPLFDPQSFGKQGAEASAQAPGRVRHPDDETQIFVPKHRPTDFLATVVNVAFGNGSAIAAGSRLVLSGRKADLSKIAALLDGLDSMPNKVDVSASWIEVTRTDGASRGISLIASVLGAKLGVSLGTVNSGNAISIKNASFEAVIDALDTDGRFNQVSNSRVVGDDYKPLTLTVGDETPTISSSGKDNAGNLVQNVVYRPSGVIVDVLPKVLGSGRINMAIDGQISSFKATQTGVSGSPTLLKRQVKTDVTVNDGEVLLIGGLNDSTSTENASGFAFLPASWSLRSHSKTQTDLVLILSAKASKL